MDENMPMQFGWTGLLQEHPILFLALRASANNNNTLVILLLLSVFSAVYDASRVYVGGHVRTRQTHHYSFIDDTHESSAPSLLSSLARAKKGRPRIILYAKAIIHFALFVGVQCIITWIVIKIARILASNYVDDDDVRQECDLLLEKGLECSAAIRYHNALNVAAVICLLCLIRGFKLHIDTPTRTRPIDDTDYSPGFVALKTKCRSMAQIILAVPITIVALHSRVSRREMWKHVGILFGLTITSLIIFLAGNFVVLLATLPDLQHTLDALEESGLTRQTKVLPLAGQ
ncbi:hypothetical protein PtrSN002B_002383 [Pyrenophora tritici-repentis]|uniref:Uncharacterized protein n=1 Tax=Pyrenophora tritici-repentis TaxID=45151 RepID=A0A316ZMY8_9PLEO|nr:hypothetical protein PtrV1_08990 [Pyrenophora tritici-repentis]KAF7441921.1 hypothetical protein A1F99_137730 [Pyrenophora tritici-repentis]KAF7567932.1 hypothetical protein PtrM4_125450 [Pyrenophora tritici-repentis]KAG9376752.1 hypothetical protein A1F94_012352 [Pyrenophora tritici-repentis]KAI0582649.1 hypothetical protein Alg130_06060 [Pyrenophora tritici-repentis]